MKKLYITTPIYYSSGKPHLGHAYTTVLADVIARYKKQCGYDVFLQTGMDEHGQKIQETAKKNKKNLSLMLDENANEFKQLWKDLDIGYDHFVRTTNKQHKKIVQKIFSYLLKKKYIYLGQWSSYYCVNCEENYSAQQVIKKNGKFYCKLGHELTYKSEPSYFLKTNQFNAWITQKLCQTKLIFPKERINELINTFLKNGLEDLSISRSKISWGIKVLENNQHVIYVWFDALLNYLTGLGYLTNQNKLFKKYWADRKSQILHLMSKEIIRFHGIYWPIILKMLKLRLPTSILAHGWIITKEGKMSKSLGNVIDPYEYINNFGSDAFRYFIIYQMSLAKDSIFSPELFLENFNNHLANNYGNMIIRLAKMIKMYNDSVIPKFNQKKIDNDDKKIISSHKKLIKTIKNDIDNYALPELINKVHQNYLDLNKYLEQKKPWKIAKLSKNNEQLNNCLNIAFNQTIDLMILLSPILVKTTKIMQKSLKIQLTFTNLNKNWQNKIIGNVPIVFARK